MEVCEETSVRPRAAPADAGADEADADADGWPRMSTMRSIALTLNLTMAMTLNILSAQSIIVALPSVGRDLNIEDSQLQWLVSSFQLAFGCLLLLAGRISDLYGHKRVFIAGSAIFCVFSIACGFAPNEVALNVFRALQGCGASASIPAALGIIGSTYPPGRSRSTAFATFSAGAPFGGSLGNVFGGILTTYAPIGWRAIYHVSAGFGALIGLCALFTVPSDIRAEVTADTSVDWIGAALVTAGLVLFTFALADGAAAERGWATPYIPALLAVSIVLIAAFVMYELRLEFRTTKTPLARLSLFRKRTFWVTQLLAFFGWACFSSHQVFVTEYYQVYLNLSPISTTIRFLPMAITGLLLNFIVAIVASIAPAQLLLALGAFGCLMAPLLFAIIPATHANYWQHDFAAMILTVFGADFTFSVGIMLCSRAAARDEQAQAGGMFNTQTQIGAAVGLAVATLVKTSTADKALAKDPRAGLGVGSRPLLAGLRAAFWTCFAFGVVGLLIAILFLRGAGIVGDKVKKPKDDALSVNAEEAAEVKSKEDHQAPSQMPVI